MKYILQVILLIVSVSVASCVSSKRDSSNLKLIETTSSHKIGYIHGRQIITTSNEGQRVKHLIDERVKEHQQYFQRRLTEHNGQKTPEIIKLAEKAKQDTMSLQNDLVEPIINDLKLQLKRYSIENKYDIVFEGEYMKNNEISVVFYNDNKFSLKEASSIINNTTASFADLKDTTKSITGNIIQLMNNKN